MNIKTPQWLAWAREIFSLSQSGLTYSGNEYDIQRYKRLQEITAEIIEAQSGIEEGAGDHVAAGAAEAVEVSDASHQKPISEDFSGIF